MQYLLLASLAAAAAAAVPEDRSRFVSYTLSLPNVGPCDYDTGPNRRVLWYYSRNLDEGTPYEPFSGQAGSLNPSTGEIRNTTVQTLLFDSNGQGPYSIGDKEGQKCSVRTGKDGNVYITDSRTRDVYRVNPKTYQVDTFPVTDQPTFNGVENTIDAWPSQSKLWVTYRGTNILRYFNYSDGSYDNFITPTCLASDCGLYGVREDNRGYIWFTEFHANKIGRFDPRTEQFIEWDIPQQREGANPGSFRSATENGRYLWANAFGGGGLIRVDTQYRGGSSPIKVYHYDSGSYPIENDVDSRGNIWISSYSRDVLAYLTPGTGKWTTVQLPPTANASAGDRTMPVHFGPGNNMWFTDNGANAIAVYKLGR